MNPEYEHGRRYLESLVNAYDVSPRTRNEATTRLQLIDRLFVECLGWSREDITTEEPHGGDYADYTFRCPRPMLIVEAKKEGDYFDLPIERVRLEYSLASLARDFPSLKSALHQVAGYAQQRGVLFAAVSNGRQVVSFVATRTDGIAPLEGRSLVFPSLRFMLAHFVELWNNLSPGAIQKRRLYERLVGGPSQDVSPKLSETIKGYPGLKSRNIFQADLQVLSELVLEDIISSPGLEDHFLQECYCQSGALSQHALIAKTLLKARYAALFDDGGGPALVTASDKKGFTTELLAESISRRPILLIGDVGAGKTTFIRRLMRVDARDIFEAGITIYLNLGSSATLTSDIAAAVLDGIESQLRDIHGIDIDERNFVHSVYRSEIQRFRNGVYGDLKEGNPGLFREKEVEFLEEHLKNRHEHLRRSLEHVSKSQKKQVVIFIDNTDQRSETEQQEAFLVAQELAERWPATVYVTLRPETFHKSRRTGTLSGYHPKAFTIFPPRVDRVIVKRLTFALKITDGRIPLPALGSQIKLQNLGAIIKTFVVSLNENEPLVECIDNISAGNIREALAYVQDFFGSGHVDTQKILDWHNRTGAYTVPVHEFLRAVIYGDCEYYNPESSPIANLFDVTTNDGREHFLVSILVSMIEANSEDGGEAGFMETANIYEDLQSLGYTPRQIDAAITRAHKSRLIETMAREVPKPDESMPKAIRVTADGVYHVERLSRMFVYLDAVLVDIPLCDIAAREQIKEVKTIAERVSRAESAVSYLDRQWQEVVPRPSFYDWDKIADDLRRDIAGVRSRIRTRW